MPFSELSAALDAAPGNVTFFFRDDDAGWGDERLCELLDVFDAERAPIDLAVIPRALSRECALELCARRARARERLGLHQHGYVHANYETNHETNHESKGRKCEFGPARSLKQQRHDVLAGQARLRALLGNIDPIFTPPWNRCSQVTVEALCASEVHVLSRDAGAAKLDLGGSLRECPVHVDWCKWIKPETDRNAASCLEETDRKAASRLEETDRKVASRLEEMDRKAASRLPVPPGWATLDRELAKAALQRETVGVMLHHAVMFERDWQALRELLRLLRAHKRVRFALMRELALERNRAGSRPAALHA